GDTLADGSRVTANRVYRLARGGFYILNGNPPINYSFSMIAADDLTTGDGTGRPPVVARGKYSTGVNVQDLFKFNGNDNNYYFENIFFTAVDLDGKYEGQWTAGLNFYGNNLRVEFKSCILNAWQAGGLTFTGENNIVYLSDNTFRNGAATYHPFVGQQANFGEHPIDSLVVTNNTYVNNQSYMLLQGGLGLADYVLFEHNTIYTSLVNVIKAPEMINAYFKSNLFYGESAYGDFQLAKDDHYYTSEGSDLATMYFAPVINQDLLTNKGLTEADRIIDISYNSYFTPQEIKDYHDAHSDATDATDNVTGTQGMFDDDTAYPHLSESNNVEKDPKFLNLDTRDYIVEELALQCEELFFSKAPGKGWGANSNRRNLDEELDGGDFMLVAWPLVEGKLKYAEATLVSGGHDGLPVGDINAFPAKRDQYAYPNGVGGMLGLKMFDGTLANDEVDFTSKGYELSSYPNPATTTANITFKLPKKANVTIS
ncbi:MAG: hypothetical protein KAH32_08475, partial [Chlamydiia bacterium]|nr:hypothetical protein [Chlamydiia bacterium]